jgi:hypothetical protein
MKFLCLAYGRAADWEALPQSEQAALLAQDEVLRRRGDLVAAVAPVSTVVRAWDGTASTSTGPVDDSDLPLAGFGLIEADDLAHAVALVTTLPAPVPEVRWSCGRSPPVTTTNARRRDGANEGGSWRPVWESNPATRRSASPNGFAARGEPGPLARPRVPWSADGG